MNHHDSTSQILVFDVGGTHLRSALAKGTVLSNQRKEPSPSFFSIPTASPGALPSLLVEKILEHAKAVQSHSPTLSGVFVGMPGVVDSTGTVVSAPPLWGNLVQDFPLRRELEKSLPCPILVANDLCGTAYYYGTHREFNQDCSFLTLLTLSTGVGCKTIDVRRSDLLLDSSGTAGEIGHLEIDPSPEAPLCDCGGRGHLSAFLSGRGLERILEQSAPAWLQTAPLKIPRGGANGSELLNRFTAHFQAGTPQAVSLLDRGAQRLATLLHQLSGTLGIDRYVLVGGLAFALGPRFIDLLRCHLTSHVFFGWSQQRVENLLVLGINDDDIGMLGAAALVNSSARRTLG